MHMNTLCLITHRPRTVWCELLEGFANYHVTMIVDDSLLDCTQYIEKYPHITFVQIDNGVCMQAGYKDTNFTLHKPVSGWDKALYYFGKRGPKNISETSGRIWFIEDDTYFYNEDTLLQIDRQYVDDDLLSNPYNVNETCHKKDWLWKHIPIQHYDLPYYSGMMCAVRMSTRTLFFIDAYATKYKTLFFLEVLFPTVAMKHGLKYRCPDQLSEVHYRKNFVPAHINRTHLYHPIKDLRGHVFLRNDKKTVL